MSVSTPDLQLARTIYIITTPLEGEQPTTPAEAKAYLANLKRSYDSDVAQYGEAVVKASPAYASMIELQAKLEPIAAKAINRVSSGLR